MGHPQLNAAFALIVALSPLFCNAFVPANSIAKGRLIRNRRVHAAPLMISSEFGGVQHAGVLVQDTKASKVTHPKAQLYHLIGIVSCNERLALVRGTYLVLCRAGQVSYLCNVRCIQTS